MIFLWPQRVGMLIKQLPTCCNIGVDAAGCQAKIAPILLKLNLVATNMKSW